VAAALEAGNYLVRQFGKRQAVGYKGAINLVTTADRQAERRIVRRIKKVFPDHSIFAEESAQRETSSEFRWIIDPLDGTTNYAHGFPVFCVAIGLEREGVPVLGVAYDPSREELFVAERGQGASLNGNPIHVSHSASLNESLLATGFPYDIRVNPDNNLAEYAAFSLRCRGVRRLGSAVLDMCYVAAGRLDGFWELRLGPWDLAAGAIMVEEAGGRITDLGGGPFTLDKGQIVASNGRIHDEMVGVLRELPGGTERMP
jgi:myo-inositol-1(or 4)-monophosphatase